MRNYILLASIIWVLSPGALFAGPRCYVAFDMTVGHVSNAEVDIATEYAHDIFELMRDPMFSIRYFRNKANDQAIFQISSRGVVNDRFRELAGLLAVYGQSIMVAGNGAAGTFERRTRTIEHQEPRWRGWLRRQDARVYSRDALVRLSEFVDDGWTRDIRHYGADSRLRLVFILSSHDLGWEFYRYLQHESFEEISEP